MKKVAVQAAVASARPFQVHADSMGHAGDAGFGSATISKAAMAVAALANKENSCMDGVVGAAKK